MSADWKEYRPDEAWVDQFGNVRMGVTARIGLIQAACALLAGHGGTPNAGAIRQAVSAVVQVANEVNRYVGDESNGEIRLPVGEKAA